MLEHQKKKPNWCVRDALRSQSISESTVESSNKGHIGDRAVKKVQLFCPYSEIILS